jgi:hypothetical protein
VTRKLSVSLCVFCAALTRPINVSISVAAANRFTRRPRRSRLTPKSAHAGINSIRLPEFCSDSGSGGVSPQHELRGGACADAGCSSWWLHAHDAAPECTQRCASSADVPDGEGENLNRGTRQRQHRDVLRSRADQVLDRDAPACQCSAPLRGQGGS